MKLRNKKTGEIVYATIPSPNYVERRKNEPSRYK